MQNPLFTVALLAMGVAFQCGADVPAQPQHSAQEHVREDSGIVRFHGTVFASPCVLMTQGRIQDVEMGEISAQNFRQAGDRSEPVRFKLYLKDCLKGASQSRGSLASRTTGNDWRAYSTGEQAVQLTFVGESDLNNGQLLRTSGTTQGAGVRLLDKNGNALDVGQTHAPWLVNSGDSELNFMAALESTGLHVSAGDFSSLVRLKMEYL